MPTPLELDGLTTEEDRLYFTLDSAVTITGDVAAVPTGWIELDTNSTYRARGRAPTGDGQKRRNRGHAHPIPTGSDEDEITFNIKPDAGVDPTIDLEIKRRTVMRLLRIKSDGYYRMDQVLVTEVTETNSVGDLPGWDGTAQGLEHPTFGKITTWPPAPAPGP